ncbi:YncE family protein [Pseudomonas baetica]|uniref:YncE family protein n=1 Tax=Pseudomonas baetica TaxID=674054 RepID=UPI00287178AE|nr:hypothetical protein [Pseudomonas baetica]MDR9863047.1 hypothetical protein [Pseudomonas baetica]
MTTDQLNGGVLANYPIKFAGATPSVIVDPAPGEGVPVEGLPQSSFKEVIKRDGSREGAVLAVVDPPLGGRYLNIVLYMEGPRDIQPQLIERKPVAPADQNDQVYFYVYQTSFSDGVHVFTYEVERASGNSSPSIESWVLYHRDLPGGNDVPGTGDHPDLTISLPAELGDPAMISKDEVDNGVPIRLSYSFMRPFDRITLELNRKQFFFTLQPGEEGKPYVIIVNRDMFEQAGNNERFLIAYTLIDQVNNPTDKRRWSKSIVANVDAGRVTLTAPDLSEDPDDPTDESETIELSRVKDFLYILVHVFAPLWVDKDVVKISYTCISPTGVTVNHIDEATVGRLPFTHKLRVPVAKVIADGQVSAIYELVRAGKVIGISSQTRAQVVGQAAPRMVLKFTNAPYKTLSGGVISTIKLLLTQDGAPVPSSSISLTLPADFKFENGDIGTRRYITDTSGMVTETGVKATRAGGVFYLAATGKDTATVTAEVNVLTAGPVGNIELGKPQRAIAISRNGTKVYAGHEGSISVIDTMTHQVVGTIPTMNKGFFAGIFLTLDGTKMYAVPTGVQEILVIDTTMIAVVKRISIEGTLGHCAMSLDGNFLVVHTNSSTRGFVQIIDSRVDQVINKYPVGAFTGGAAISPDGQIFYYCEYGSSTSKLVAMELGTGRRIKELTVVGNRGYVFLDSAGKSIFLPPSNQAGALLEVDAVFFEQRRTIPTESNTYFASFSSDGLYLFLCVYAQSGKCLVYDARSGALLNTFVVGSYPSGIAVAPDGRLFICNQGSNFVSVLRFD